MKRITGHEFVGQVFYRLTIISVSGFHPRRGALVNARCSCGSVKEFKLYSIRSGDSKSCGCLLREQLLLPTRERNSNGRKRKKLDPIAKWASQKKWIQSNPKIVSEAARRFREKHKDQIRAEKAEYYQRSKRRIIAKLNFRFKTDIAFRIEATIRANMRKALRPQRTLRSKRMLELLGCTIKEFRAHLESLFTKGMSWDGITSGKIHIDHKLPVRSFDLRDPAQQMLAFHYTNMQPLWAKDNLSKSDKLPNGKRARDIKRALTSPA